MRKTIQKFFLLALLAVFALPMQAQNEGAEAADTVGEKDIPTALFGFFSYNEVLEAMPDMTLLKKKMADQRSQYEAELKRAEEEFNKKYEEFLDGQSELAPSILQKRQSELQELMNRNLAFKEEAQRLLKQAEEEAFAPLRLQLSDLLNKIGQERGYAFIYDTDTKALPFLNPDTGEDINELVIALLAK